MNIYCFDTGIFIKTTMLNKVCYDVMGEIFTFLDFKSQMELLCVSFDLKRFKGNVFQEKCFKLKSEKQFRYLVEKGVGKYVKSLNIRFSNVSHVLQDILYWFTELDELSVSYTDISRVDFKGFEKLSKLNISSCDIENRDFSKMKKLKSLKMGNQQWKEDGNNYLCLPNSIEELGLELNHEFVDDKQFVYIANNCPYIKTINIRASSVTNKCIIDNIPNMKNLTSVDFTQNSIKDDVLYSLSEMKNIRKLILSDNDITVDGISYLQNSNVTDLDISKNYINKEDIRELLKIKTLKTLNLSYNDITNDEIYECVSDMGYKNKITIINDDYNIDEDNIQIKIITPLQLIINYRKDYSEL